MRYTINRITASIDRNELVKTYKRWKETALLAKPIIVYNLKHRSEPLAYETMLSQVKRARRNFLEMQDDIGTIELTRHSKRGTMLERARVSETAHHAFIRCLGAIRERIRDARQRLKDDINDGLTRKEPGYWYRELLKKAYRDKAPKDDKKYIGLELELMAPDGTSLEEALAEFKNYVSLTGDGSIDAESGYYAREVRILVPRSELKLVVDGVTSKLQAVGCKVNKSCGLHVHLDMRNTTQEQRGIAYKNLYHALGLLYQIVPPSRKNNTYCRRNQTGVYARQGHDRYKAINVTAYRQHSTFEIRLFGGTIDATKILNWVALLTHIMSGDTVNRCPKDFDTAQKYYRYSDTVKQWAKDRQACFSRSSGTQGDGEESNNLNIQDGDLITRLAGNHAEGNIIVDALVPA